MFKTDKVLFGGDYNPDQWPDEEIYQDIPLMKELGINTVTLPVFSWARLQPSEEVYDFVWLDRIMDILKKEDISVIMATPTAAQPAWMDKKYPGILPTGKNGIKRRHGGRTHFCPGSPDYRRLSGLMARRMAEHYKDNENILLWHINNEYGSYCYCEQCRQNFILWLKQKYTSLEELNRRWFTAFWGHTLYDWDEVEVPSHQSELLPGRLAGRDGCNFQIMLVDYHRFMSDSMLDCYRNEENQIKQIIPEALCTTNVWGISPSLDLHKWGRAMDVVSWDNYPGAEDKWWEIAFRHDVIRGIGEQKPFLLMEQTPSQQNWMQYNYQKRPGIMALHSWQAVAHGSDSVLFFQVKQGLSACEKYHAALIPHAGHLKTRISGELIALSENLKQAGKHFLGKPVRAQAALIMDWDNWHNVDHSSGPSVNIQYLPTLMEWYAALAKAGIGVDIISPHDDFTGYRFLMAPLYNMMDSSEAKKIEEYVHRGGCFVSSYFSGLTNRDDQVHRGGYPGALRNLMGIWVEEADALPPGTYNGLKAPENELTLCSVDTLCEVIHLETAKALAVYEENYYKDMPAVTVNCRGDGRACYIGCRPEPFWLEELLLRLCEDGGVKPLLNLPDHVEMQIRGEGEDAVCFLINHSENKSHMILPPGQWLNQKTGEGVNQLEMAPFETILLAARPRNRS